MIAGKSPEIWKLAHADIHYKSKSRFEMLRATESFVASKKGEKNRWLPESYVLIKRLLIHWLHLARADKERVLFFEVNA